MTVYYEKGKDGQAASREVGYSWNEASLKETEQLNIKKHTLTHNLRQFEMEMMWMLRWMTARWEVMRTTARGGSSITLNRLQQLETESSAINARSEIDIDPSAHANEVSISNLDSWQRELQSINEHHQLETQRWKENEVQFEEWYANGESMSEEDIELLRQGAKAYQEWRIQAQERELRTQKKQAVPEEPQMCEVNVI